MSEMRLTYCVNHHIDRKPVSSVGQHKSCITDLIVSD